MRLQSHGCVLGRRVAPKQVDEAIAGYDLVRAREVDGEDPSLLRANEDGSLVTFTWVSGCFGNWAMSYAVDGDQVTWSDIEALAPNDSEEDQHVAEVFNSVAWTRAEDAPE